MDKQAIIEILRPLGELETGAKGWLDYSVYGFTAEDAPTLVELAIDKSSDLLNEDNGSWVPVHAWRALKHLMPAGLHELIATFDILLEDFWADNEIPHVLAEAGEEAVGPLLAVACDNSRSMATRSFALTVLEKVAERFPELREQIVTAFAGMLHQCEPEENWLGAMLVSELIDLQAADRIDVIRDAYARDCVDWSVCGDLEDIEIALGLRVERDTPQPRYGAYRNGKKPEPPSLKPLKKLDSYWEIGQRIMQFIDYYGSQKAVGGVGMLDGMLTAIGCAPQPVPPSVWLSAVWGGDELQPAWPDKESAQVFLNLLMHFHNYVMGALQDIDHYQAAIDKFVYSESGETVSTFVSWSDGFMRGVEFWDMSEPDVDKTYDFVSIIADMSGFEGLKQELELTSRQREVQERILNTAVRGIYKINRHVAVPVIRSEPKVGRNDPCPCGSGKKYKKCCMH